MKTELGKIIAVKNTADGYSFVTENGSIDIGFKGPCIILFEYNVNSYNVPNYLNDAIKQLYSAELDHRKVTLTEQDDCWKVSSDDIAILVSKADSAVSVYRDGVPVHGGRAGGKDTVIPQSQFRLVEEGSRKTGRFDFALDDDDMFFGLGDKTGSPDHRGQRYRMYNKDALGYDASFSDPLYKSIPFVLKFNRGKGINAGYFFASPCIEAVDLGRESPFYWSTEINGGPFRFFLILGDDYRQVLNGYCSLTGFPAFPPLYSFGYLGSSMNYVEAYDAQKRIEMFFEDVEKYGLPCEGMYVSSGYLKSDDGLRHAFVWNRRKFPDPAAFIRSLQERGYHLLFNIKPGILKTHPQYAELADKGYFIKDNSGNPIVEYFWGGDASFIDFSNPEACNWWKAKLNEAYLDAGAEGIWNDNNEFELSDPELEAYRIRSVYPCLMTRTSYEACREKNPGKRPWIYSRSGYSGIQKYARTWSGDNSSNFNTLRFNQFQGAGMGVCGLTFVGHDLGGFYGPEPSAELLARCCQSAIFQSRFVIHSWREDDRPTEPWKFSEVFPIIRQALFDHYRHMPYIYNEARHCSLTGEPMERLVVLEYPADPALEPAQETFMFGRSVLKAPVLNQGETQKTVRFPQGDDWYSPSLGKLIAGGTQKAFDTPLDTTWYFYRTGSIIPMSNEICKLTTGFFRNLNMSVLPKNGEFTFTYFEDDGVSEITDGSHNIWKFTVSYDEGTSKGAVRVNLKHCGNPKTLRNRNITISFPKGFEGGLTFSADAFDGATIPFSGSYIRL